jgi:hypothetical protein
LSSLTVRATGGSPLSKGLANGTYVYLRETKDL